jgi:hypothetical protein
MSPVLRAEGSRTLQGSVVEGRRRTGFPLLIVFFFGIFPTVSYRCNVQSFSPCSVGVEVSLAGMPKLYKEVTSVSWFQAGFQIRIRIRIRMDPHHGSGLI